MGFHFFCLTFNRCCFRLIDLLHLKHLKFTTKSFQNQCYSQFSLVNQILFKVPNIKVLMITYEF